MVHGCLLAWKETGEVERMGQVGVDACFSSQFPVGSQLANRYCLTSNESINHWSSITLETEEKEEKEEKKCSEQGNDSFPVW